MSSDPNTTPAEILINATIKMVGKREFLKTIEKLYGIQKAPVNGLRHKVDVPAESQCSARCKGERTGIKVGRYVLFDNVRCERKEVDEENHLCAIHSNQVAKFGELPFGKFEEPLTEDLKKVFGEI